MEKIEDMCTCLDKYINVYAYACGYIYTRVGAYINVYA